MAISWMKRVLVGVMLLALLSGCAGFSFGQKKEPVTLKFVFLENTADYQSLADAFNRQNSHITVELRPVKMTGNVMRELALQAAESDAIRMPVMMLNADLTSALLPLDPMISANMKFPVDDIFPGSLDGLKMDGRQLGLPAGLNPYVMFYNPEKFSAAGMPPPNAGWQLDDFMLAATSLNNVDESLRGTDRLTYGFCSHPSLPDSIMFTYLFGGSLVENLYRFNAPTLNSPANIEALNWYVSLSTDFGLLPPANRIEELGRAVYRGNCAFWMDWFDATVFGQALQGENGRAYGMLPLPNHVSRFDIMTMDTYSLLARTLHPEEAFLWINFLMQQEAASGKLIPPLKSQIESEEYAVRAGADRRAIARSFSGQPAVIGLDMFRDEFFGTVMGLFAEASSQAMQGNLSPADALNQAQQKAEQALP